MASQTSALVLPRVAAIARRFEYLLAGLTLIVGSGLTWAVSGLSLGRALSSAVIESFLGTIASPEPVALQLESRERALWAAVIYASAVLQLVAGLYLCRVRAGALATVAVIVGFFVCLADLLYGAYPWSKQLDAYAMACAFVVLPTALKLSRAD